MRGRRWGGLCRGRPPETVIRGRPWETALRIIRPQQSPARECSLLLRGRWLQGKALIRGRCGGGARSRGRRARCTSHPTPYTLHPTPHTPHPTPYALHPTPHTLQPTPHALHQIGEGAARQASAAGRDGGVRQLFTSPAKGDVNFMRRVTSPAKSPGRGEGTLGRGEGGGSQLEGLVTCSDRSVAVAGGSEREADLAEQVLTLSPTHSLSCTHSLTVTHSLTHSLPLTHSLADSLTVTQSLNDCCTLNPSSVTHSLTSLQTNVRGYLVHKKPPPPLAPPSDHRHAPTVGS